MQPQKQAEHASSTYLHRINEQRERFTAGREMQHANMEVDALLLLLPGDCCRSGSSSQCVGHIGMGSGPASTQALLLQGAAYRGIMQQSPSEWLDKAAKEGVSRCFGCRSLSASVLTARAPPWRPQ